MAFGKVCFCQRRRSASTRPCRACRGEHATRFSPRCHRIRHQWFRLGRQETFAQPTWQAAYVLHELSADAASLGIHGLRAPSEKACPMVKHLLHAFWTMQPQSPTSSYCVARCSCISFTCLHHCFLHPTLQASSESPPCFLSTPRSSPFPPPSSLPLPMTKSPPPPTHPHHTSP